MSKWRVIRTFHSSHLPSVLRELEPWMTVQNLLKSERPIMLSEEDQQALMTALKIGRNWKGHKGEPPAEDWEALVSRMNDVLAEAVILQLILQGRMTLTLDNHGNVAVGDGSEDYKRVFDNMLEQHREQLAKQQAGEYERSLDEAEVRELEDE